MSERGSVWRVLCALARNPSPQAGEALTRILAELVPAIEAHSGGDEQAALDLLAEMRGEALLREALGGEP